MRHVGISLRHETDRAAEHWLGSLGLPAGAYACTHLMRAPHPHVAISLALPDGVYRELPDVPAELREAADEAAAAHAGRRSGRAVLFPGVAALTGTVTIAELLDASAIERVTVLGGGVAEPDQQVLTRDFVRPQWMDGLLTLVTSPAPGGRLAPFEVPDPTPCCGGDH